MAGRGPCPLLRVHVPTVKAGVVPANHIHLLVCFHAASVTRVLRIKVNCEDIGQANWD